MTSGSWFIFSGKVEQADIKQVSAEGRSYMILFLQQRSHQNSPPPLYLLHQTCLHTSLASQVLPQDKNKQNKTKKQKVIYNQNHFRYISSCLQCKPLKPQGKLKDSKTQGGHRKKWLGWGERKRGGLGWDYKFILQFHCWKQGTK